ncbi:hypothetical protein LVY65_11575 [Sphingomonas sp. G124]|uniref:Uncharacterized protein n=1 Tax=Sphingomonas cremea TaxID=2904799 RepID=A0A9X1QNF0_9SPHN|nr:hypothetical protein [Sphingomonas cremea]MCF2515699.1 hypothetical protein [Sphingomonas cremea]
MTMMTKVLMSGAGFAAIAAAAPATAQYAYPYRNSYYANSYATNMAAERCAAAVQTRLSYRNTNIFGVLLGANSNARVLSVTRVNPNRNSVRVRGIASSGRMAYNPYGVGAYGMLGANYAPRADLSFKCDVDYRGYVRDVDINRR